MIKGSVNSDITRRGRNFEHGLNKREEETILKEEIERSESKGLKLFIELKLFCKVFCPFLG